MSNFQWFYSNGDLPKMRGFFCIKYQIKDNRPVVLSAHFLEKLRLNYFKGGQTHPTRNISLSLIFIFFFNYLVIESHLFGKISPTFENI